MGSKRIYGTISAVLAVALGLGLIYLYAQGRIDAFTAIATVLAMAFLMIVLAALADVASDDRRRGRARMPAHRP
jgi:uncharacterized membrane protein YbhN (UPF0104 family)